jgi:perosamine synthetase
MTTGEGGLVTCSDDAVADKVRRLINHGQKEKYLHTEIGYNYRLTNMGAAIGRIQLKKLDWMNRQRQENAGFFTSRITRKGIVCPSTREGCTHVYHQYAIRVTPDTGCTRDQFAAMLQRNGVGTAVHYPIPVHEQPVFKGKIPGSACPVSARLADEILSLPVYPSLLPAERDTVCKIINEGE